MAEHSALSARTFVPGIALALCACASSSPSLQTHDDRYQVCGQRPGELPLEAGETAVSGTLQDIKDQTPVDGPVTLVIIDGQGQPLKMYFQSMYTVPRPSPEHMAAYQVIASSHVGDCVRITGKPMSDGLTLVNRFVNLSQPTLGSAAP